MLPSVAIKSAQQAMMKYEGVHIDCEYLGIVTDDHVSEADVKYVRNPLHWPATRGVSPSKKVYAKWTVQSVESKTSQSVNDPTTGLSGEAVTSIDVADLFYHGRTFPEPSDLLYIVATSIAMERKAIGNPYAPCVFEKLNFAPNDDCVAEFAWIGVYHDNALEHPYRSVALVSNLLRSQGLREVPGNPVKCDIIDTLTFTIVFYDNLGLKLGLKFAGVLSCSKGTPSVEHRAPQRLDSDCVWVVKSGRAIVKPAGDIVSYNKRQELFGSDCNKTLETDALCKYSGTFGFKGQTRGQLCCLRRLTESLQTSFGRNRLACARYGYFACLGVPDDPAAFARIRQVQPTLHSEPWSVTTWSPPIDDCVSCWWVVNAPLEEAQVLVM